MPSFGKMTKRLILKAANEGGKKKAVVGDMTQAGKVGKVGEAEAPHLTYVGKRAKANDNVPDAVKAIKKADDQSQTVMKLLELHDSGDLFALNKYAKKHFNMSWSQLKKDPQIKDML